MQSPIALPVGCNLSKGRYTILKKLGAGGYGSVYLARDNRLSGRPVAVKALHDPSPEAERLFRREATLLASLDHPGLVGVSDYFGEEHSYYLVMDYIDGRDLLDVAIEADKANRLLPVDQVAEWMLHVCEAVVYLHRQTPPIVHRDIKPGNIRLNAAGRAILVDFGIAKIDPKSKTQSMAKAVSVGFSPPEQYAGGGGTDTRSDVYALGATLYCLLTVQSPPDGFDRLMRDAPLVPPSRINHLVSPTLEEVVLKAMSLGIEQRYRDAGEMLAAFRAATERGTPLVTRSVCAHCGHANRSGARFCARCGTPFGAAFTCPACGAAVRSTSRFCPRCGRETGSREVGSK